MTVPPAVICDLDGVVYRGQEAIAGSRHALRRLRDAGCRIVFATNNSSRTPESVAKKLHDVVGFETRVDDIVTSAQAAASVLPSHLSRCFVVGGPGVTHAVEDRGFAVVDDADSADCVVVGLDRAIDYEKIATAAMALRRGAYFVATNTDPTFPAPEGLFPGAGAIVSAIATASGRTPVVAGKPEAAMIELIRDRGVTKAWVVGDRLDTDVALATNEGTWKSVLVLSGVTTSDEDHSAADLVAEDLNHAVGLLLSRLDRQ